MSSASTNSVKIPTAHPVEPTAEQQIKPAEDYPVEPLPDENVWRGHLRAGLGEFVGTFMFLWFAFVIADMANHDYLSYLLESDTVNVNPVNVSKIWIIACGFGFSVTVAINIFGSISGGNLNPAVTLTLVLSRTLSPLRGLIMFISQLIACMAAAGAASAMTPGPVLFANKLGGGCSKSRGLMLETFGTAVLCTTVLFTAVSNPSNPVNPEKIGLSLLIANLACIYYTGAGINPARSFGPCVAARSFPVYHWIYWVGPFIGAVISVCIWESFKYLEEYPKKINKSSA